MAAVGIDIGTGPRGAETEGCISGDGQLDEQRDRAVVRLELDVEAEPGVAL
jgi:hypothetical protein